MKFTRNIFVLALVIFNLISCSTKKEKSLSTHKIIFLTSYYEEYVAAAKNLNQKGRDSCMRKLRELMFIRYFTKCEITERFNDRPEDSTLYTNDLNEFSKTIQLVNQNKELIQHKIENALAKCYDYLPYDSVTIFIIPSRLKKEDPGNTFGVGGFTPGSHHILLFLDPYFEKMERYDRDRRGS